MLKAQGVRGKGKLGKGIAHKLACESNTIGKGVRAMTAEQGKAAAVKHLAQAQKELATSSKALRIRVAICRFFLEEMGITAQAERDELMQAWLATPVCFGASANTLVELEVIPETHRGARVVPGIKA